MYVSSWHLFSSARYSLGFASLQCRYLWGINTLYNQDCKRQWKSSMFSSCNKWILFTWKLLVIRIRWVLLWLTPVIVYSWQTLSVGSIWNYPKIAKSLASFLPEFSIFRSLLTIKPVSKISRIYCRYTVLFSCHSLFPKNSINSNRSTVEQNK